MASRSTSGRGRRSARRRERLRQVDGGAHAAEAARAEQRLHPRRRRRHHRARCHGDAAVPQAHADDLSGPVRVAQPAHVRGAIVGEPLIDPRRRRGAGAGGARRFLFELVGLRPELMHPLPARVLRWAAPAHRHRPRARPQAPAHRRRRAGVGARRLDPGADHQPADGPAGRVQALLLFCRTISPWSSTSRIASPSCISAASSR